MQHKSQALKGDSFDFFYFFRGCTRDCGTDGGCGDVYPERPMFFSGVTRAAVRHDIYRGLSWTITESSFSGGYLTQIKLSQRKIRFDEDEILHFANVGMPAS